MARGEPHAAFPSAPVPSGSRGGGGPITPPTAEELRTIIDQSTTLSIIQTILVPACEAVAASEDQSALLQADVRLEELPDADLAGSTTALVYILYVPPAPRLVDPAD